MVMLSPAVQMPALSAGRSHMTGISAAALQPTIQNIAGYRWPQANTYVTLALQIFVVVVGALSCVFHVLQYIVS